MGNEKKTVLCVGGTMHKRWYETEHQCFMVPLKSPPHATMVSEPADYQTLSELSETYEILRPQNPRIFFGYHFAAPQHSGITYEDVVVMMVEMFTEGKYQFTEIVEWDQIDFKDQGKKDPVRHSAQLECFGDVDSEWTFIGNVKAPLERDNGKVHTVTRKITNIPATSSRRVLGGREDISMADIERAVNEVGTFYISDDVLERGNCPKCKTAGSLFPATDEDAAYCNECSQEFKIKPPSPAKGMRCSSKVAERLKQGLPVPCFHCKRADLVLEPYDARLKSQKAKCLRCKSEIIVED